MNSELDTQYKAQVDVIHQLEAKLLKQLQQQKQTATDAQKTTLIKLSRDFERVQQRAAQLIQRVTRLHKQQAADLSAGRAFQQDAAQTSNSNNVTQEDHYEQVQLQMEEDVSAMMMMYLSIYVSIWTCTVLVWYRITSLLVSTPLSLFFLLTFPF
jgi:hypothetical protein